MSSLDDLPGDQRAVLEMVLKRGRSYDEIARLLSLERSAVRERAQIALDAIGPHTGVAPEHQHRVADYLLGQLSGDEAEQVREMLADSPSDRAWARVVASELAPVAGERPIPEIPTERSAPFPGPAPAASTETEPEPEPGRRRGRRRRTHGEDGDPPAEAPRSSRLGGALVIIAGVLAVAAVLFFVLRGGNSKTHTTSNPTAPQAASTTSVTPSTTSTSTSGSSTSAKVVAQINLTPPSGNKQSKAAGIAEVLNEGTTDGIAIVAQNVPPNRTTKPLNAYAVWLYNSPKDAKILGFVNPGVGKTGRLSTAGALPSNASHYKNLIVTLESTGSPKAPGAIILQGALTGL